MASQDPATTADAAQKTAPREREIPFTQYLMPNGRRQDVFLPVDEETHAKASMILAAGLCFEVEMLSDFSTVSATITDASRGDLAFAVCPNGPELPVKIKDMIMRFRLPADNGRPVPAHGSGGGEVFSRDHKGPPASNPDGQ